MKKTLIALGLVALLPLSAHAAERSYTYAEGAPVETYFPAVVGLLRPYLAVVPGSSGARCVEAGRG